MDLSRAPRIDAGPKRFAELETSLPGITPAVLTARLRQLQANGLTPDAEPYSYRLRWDEELSIERGHAEAAIVTVLGVAGLDVVYSTDGMSEEEEQALSAA